MHVSGYFGWKTTDADCYFKIFYVSLFLYLPQNLPKYIEEARKPAYRPAQNNKNIATYFLV